MLNFDNRPRGSATSDSSLTPEQRQALEALPEHEDPFFAVHCAMHAIKAAYVGERSIPLSGVAVSGECGAFSNCAAMSLRRLFHIDPNDLVIVQLSTFIHGCTPQEVLDRNLPRKTDGEHTILYIKNGLRFLPGNHEGDVFFDSTAAQFPSDSWREKRTENVFGFLRQYGGAEGDAMAEALHKRGYVKIPPGTAGMRRLGVLVAAYYAEREWPPHPEPIAPESLYARQANETQGSRASKYFDKLVPLDPHRYHEWGWELLFDPGVPYGQLKLEHPGFDVPYYSAWHEADV